MQRSDPPSPDDPDRAPEAPGPGEPADPRDPGEAADPRDPGEAADPRDPGEAADPRDALRRIEQRLDRASEAAERLFAEATQSAARAAGSAAERLKPPAAGWQAPGEPRGTTSSEARPPGEELLAQLLQSLRELIPPELQRRLAEALRELLLALRALIDWYVQRLERRRAEPDEVEDIPIL
jgi:hypothetical protein